jgi:hypothetical protein
MEYAFMGCIYLLNLKITAINVDRMFTKVAKNAMLA